MTEVKEIENGANGKHRPRKPQKKNTRDSLIKHVNLTVEAFLGEAQITIAELGDLEADSVIELNANLNQAVELRLNGVSIAHGELVAVGDNFGVRIIDLAQ